MSDLFTYQLPAPAYGTEPHKLSRNEDPATSKAAGHSVETTKLEAMVHNRIDAAGEVGCIADDVLASFPDHAYSSITARFKALKDKGLIVAGPDTRKGRSGRQQRVMRACDAPVEPAIEQPKTMAELITATMAAASDNELATVLPLVWDATQDKATPQDGRAFRKKVRSGAFYEAAFMLLPSICRLKIDRRVGGRSSAALVLLDRAHTAHAATVAGAIAVLALALAVERQAGELTP